MSFFKYVCLHDKCVQSPGTSCGTPPETTEDSIVEPNVFDIPFEDYSLTDTLLIVLIVLSLIQIIVFVLKGGF